MEDFKFNKNDSYYLLYESNSKINSSFIQTVKDLFSNPFKFKVIELVISGLLLAIYLLIYSFFKATGISYFISGEIICYILIGIILGPTKGSFVAFVADAFGLIVWGQIGTWYWLYAIWPPIIAFISSLYFAFLKNSKVLKMIVPFIVIGISIGIVLYFFNNNVVRSDTGNVKFIGIKMSKSNQEKWENISWLSLIIALFAYLSLMFVFVIVSIVLWKVKKQEKFLNYILVLSLITFIIVIYRWVFGPIIFIKFLSHITGKNYNIGDRYLIYFIPIVIKSLFTIPVFTLIFSALYPILIILKENHINYRNQMSY